MTSQPKHEFTSPLLERVVTTAKSMGYKVWALDYGYTKKVSYTRMDSGVSITQEPPRKIDYIIIDNGATIGYCQGPPYDLLEFSTIHAYCKTWGGGFKVEDTSSTRQAINECLSYAPEWALRRWGDSIQVQKLTFAGYQAIQLVPLKYFEI